MANTLITNFFADKLLDYLPTLLTSNSYYLAASKHSEWDDEDLPPAADQSSKTLANFHREILYGKKIKSADIIRLIRRNTWVSNTAYSQYDDEDTELYTNDFFVINSSGAVYKCLFNNNGGQSTVEPTTISTSTFQTSDNYIWKYMYTVSSANNTLFTTPDYIPIDSNSSVISAAVNSAINVIEITTSGNNYIATVTGTVANVISDSTFRIQSTHPLSVDDDFYSEGGFYITSGTGVGQLATISQYVVNAAGKFILTSTPINSPALDTTSEFRIAPQIKITGDGTGAAAICTVNTSSGLYYIDNITVINAGQNYSYANVEIISNPAYGESATARAIISPIGGHGKDPWNELASTYIGVIATFYSYDSNNLPTDIEFRQYGLITPPEKYTLPSTSYSFNALTNVSNTNDTISFTDANTKYAVGDRVQYLVATGNTAVTGISNASYYYIVAANTTTIQLSSTLDGPTINLTASVSQTGHTLSTSNTYNDNTFNSLTKLTIIPGTGVFEVNEVVVGSTSNAQAAVAFANSTVLRVSHTTGTFTNTENIVGINSAATGTINAINNPDIKRFTSEVLYLNNFEAATKTQYSSEKAYMIIDLSQLANNA